MRILIGCECSGIIREAFKARGHDAWSCDLKPSELPGQHIQDDLLLQIDTGEWDLMIAHPECTFLTVSNTYITRGCSKYTKEEAEKLRSRAVLFFVALVNAPIGKVCIENPIGIMSTLYKKPTQIIQPWHFGHPESKATCLWLKGLPRLNSTGFAEFKNYRCRCGNVFEASAGKYGCCTDYAAKPLWDNMTPSGQNKLGPSPTRSADRARTYSGIAEAMAAQWGM